jgi:hypothetical protein
MKVLCDLSVWTNTAKKKGKLRQKISDKVNTIAEKMLKLGYAVGANKIKIFHPANNLLLLWELIHSLSIILCVFYIPL